MTELPIPFAVFCEVSTLSEVELLFAAVRLFGVGVAIAVDVFPFEVDVSFADVLPFEVDVSFADARRLEADPSFDVGAVAVSSLMLRPVRCYARKEAV